MSAIIGSRWRPGHVERRDTETGLYEQINSRMDHHIELSIQRALLTKMPAYVERRIAMARAAIKGEAT